MYPQGTIYYFQTFVLLQQLFCINRYYLIERKTVKYLSLLLFISTIMTVFGLFIYDFFILDLNVNYVRLMLQLISCTEVIYLATSARERNTFNAIDKLEEKCGVDSDYSTKIKRIVTRSTQINVISAVLNFAAAAAQSMSISMIVLFCITTSAQDSEMDVICFLIEGFNIRLSKLKDASSTVGSRVYRHILMTTSHLGEEFSSKILVMIFSILLKTLIYAVFAVLFDTDALIITLLLWRQTRSIYSLWMLCLAASNTKSICNNLVFHLAEKLVLDPMTNKAKHRKNYYITRRWYQSVFKERPRYMSGAVESIDLNIPFIIFDVTVNYLLIIIQVYAAYK